MTFVLPDGAHHTVVVGTGLSVLEAARLGRIDIEGACGGAMACATCHVHVDEAWYERLDAASPEEEDMLDLASEYAATSRLGCQIWLDGRLDGLVVRVPRSTLLDG